MQAIFKSEGGAIQESLEYDDVSSCEGEFVRLGSEAVRLETTLRQIGIEAKRLSSAVITGNLQSIRKTRASILTLVAELESAIGGINKFDDQAVARSVGTRKYLQEIVDQALSMGLEGARVVGLTVLAFPNRLSVDQKGIKIGRKAISSVRPSYIAKYLKDDRDATGDAQPGFIDALAAAYKAKASPELQVVSLSDIYELLTLLPDVRKNYGEADFVRDLSVIDAQGPHKSKDGKTIAFVAATGTRMNAGFKGVSPSGEDVTYVSIRFD